MAPIEDTYYFACHAIMTHDNGILNVKHETENGTRIACSIYSGDDDDGR